MAGWDTYARLSLVATTTRAGSGALDRYFGITARGSTVRREVRGGLVTFMTMAYIVVLNPLIIGTVAGRGRPGARHRAGRRRHRAGRRR